MDTFGIGSKEAKKIFERARSRSVLVLGDIMLDKYITGDVNRISPEAPVQVIDVKKESFTLGGAANTCFNMLRLGCRVSACGIVGDDEAGGKVLSSLREYGIGHSMVITDSTRRTTQKIRVVGLNQQLVRIDYESRHKISDRIRDKVFARLDEELNGQDAIIISDYAKGMVRKSIVRKLIDAGKRVLVDPKPKNIDFYKGAYLIKPNLKEAREITGMDPKDDAGIRRMGLMMLDMLDSNILITAGSRGMYLFEKDGSFSKFPTKVRAVFDVSGAGDTVIATVASCLAAGTGLKAATAIANYAAGIVVGKAGTATVTPDEILKEIDDEKGSAS